MHAALRRCAAAAGVTSPHHHPKHPSTRLLYSSSSARNNKRPAMASPPAAGAGGAAGNAPPSTLLVAKDIPKHMPADPYPHGLTSIGGATLAQTLARLGNELSLGALPSSGSAFVKPGSVSYSLDAKQRRWDVIEAHPSVGVVLYHEDKDAFLVVRQFRPAVYASLLSAAQQKQTKGAGASSSSSSPLPLHEAFTFELCAGLCDKDDLSPQEIAAEEILEECGYRVAPKDVRPVTSAVSSAGTAGAPHALFFARVSESMRVKDEGGGLAETGEAIEVLALPFDRADDLVLDGAKLSMSPGLQFGLTWAAKELEKGALGGRGGNGKDDDGLLTAELRLKPVLPA